MISKRSLLSLCEFLSLQPNSNLRVLLAKHDICDVHDELYRLEDIVYVMEDAGSDRQQSLLSEIVRTGLDLRSRVEPRYRYDVRWNDLERCLLMDGYKIESHQLVAVDPTVEGAEPLDDDLTRLLNESGLQESTDIVASLNASTDAFRGESLNVNACLNNARIALETAAKAIASRRRHTFPMVYDESKWGSVLGYLRKSNFITKREEEGLAGVYTFTSEGAHNPLGADEVEMARLGRNLCIGMLYFLVKLYTGEAKD